MSYTPTPETDNQQDDMLHADTYTCWQETLKLARKLERERDEARAELALEKIPVTVDAVEREEWRQERNQLRKVCDEFFNCIVGDGNTCHKPLRDYLKLPHVVERNKEI
jgi:hypothetical protein